MKILPLILLPSLAFAGALDQPAQRASPYSADQLIALYEKNAIAAAVKVGGQVIKISGTVDQIESDAIFFRTNNASITDIKAYIDPSALADFAKLRVGAHVVIVGTVGKLHYSDIEVTGCKVAK